MNQQPPRMEPHTPTALETSLALKQAPSPVLMPVTLQSLQILAMAAGELHERVEAELLSNPILQRVSPPVEHDDWYPQNLHPRSEEDAVTEVSPSLAEHLAAQLRLAPLPPSSRALALYLVHSLDPDGYLRIPLEEISGRLNRPFQQVLEALRYVQQLDPTGVGARSLQECLLIQLERSGSVDPALRSLIEFHLGDLARGDLGRIAKRLGVSRRRVNQLRDALLAFEPVPGRGFGPVHSAIPPDAADVIVRRAEDRWLISLSDRTAPQLAVDSKTLMELRQQAAGDSEVLRYLRERVVAAKTLINGVDRRRQTLLAVMEALLTMQAPFFEEGIGALRPLTLRTMAGALGIHESTVSRAVMHKWLSTPCGWYRMRRLFDRSTAPWAPTAVKLRMQRLIAEESPERPLSDREIWERLRQEGVPLSRRVVAKYRAQVGIPAAHVRKVTGRAFRR